MLCVLGKDNLMMPFPKANRKGVSILNFPRVYDCIGKCTSPLGAVFRSTIVGSKMDEGLSRRRTADGGKTGENLCGLPIMDERKIRKACSDDRLQIGEKQVKTYLDGGP